MMFISDGGKGDIPTKIKTRLQLLSSGVQAEQGELFLHLKMTAVALMSGVAMVQDKEVRFTFWGPTSKPADG